MLTTDSSILNSKGGLSEIEAEYITRSLLKECVCVSPNEINGTVLTLLGDHPEIISLPIVDNNKPVGLINRSVFMDEMAKPFRREVFFRKKCTVFMEENPLIANENMSIQMLSFKVIDNGSKALKDGFIITDEHGDYLGVGTGEDLMRVISNLQAEKNRLVMESINYASVIQTSFLRSSREDLSASLSDYFVHWEPRDKVGGDYYFCKKFADGFFIALIDCTGHGVPGAFMTLIITSFLDHLLHEENRHNPALLLELLNRKVKSSLGQIGTNVSESGYSYTIEHTQSDDGMDAGFLWVNPTAGEMTFAGAKTPLYTIVPGATEATNWKGDKKGVGYIDTPMDFKWTNQTIPLSGDLCVYMTTDGIIDQIGGAKNISYGKVRFCDILLANRDKPMVEQKDLVLDSFYEYQGKQRRRDDVSFLGFRI